MKSRTIGTLLTVCAIGLTTAVASAQQGQGRGFGMRGFGGPLMLIRNEAVQKELALAEETQDKLKKIGDEVRAEFPAGGGNAADFQNLSREEQRKRFEELGETMRNLQTKYLPKLKEALTADQFTRLQQISWQAAGGQAFSDPEIVKALALSDEQNGKIQTLNREYGEKQRALFGEGGAGNRDEIRAKMSELNKERDEKLTQVLTKDQQEKFTALKGKPFDLSQLRTERRPQT